MQKKKISIGLIIAVICLTLILIVAQNLNIKNTDNLSPEMRKALSYGVVEEGDDKTESDNVKFIAYFMKDINGDGKKEKIKGSCNKIGYEDILYMDLSVLSGKLENAKITVNGNNFYLQTEIIADSIVSSDRISENTKDIELKSISGNISKTLIGLVKSGDYAYVTNNKLALNQNPNNYTANNSIVLSGTYISDDGEVININKTVNLTIDWYGDINVEIPKKLYGKNNTYQVKDMETAIDQVNNKLNIEFIVGIQETKNETLLKSAYIEGTIPELNGYAPSNVSVSGTNVSYTYDEQNRKFTAKREPVIEDGKITENAYSVTYAENNVNYRANEFNVKVEYPLEAYASTGDNFINLNIPVSGYYEGYNNSGEGFKNPLKSEKASNYINVFYMEGADTNKTFDITTGKSVIYPVKRNVVSSEEIYSQYTKSVAENEGYTVRWDIFSGDKENIDSIILKDNKQSDEFIKSDGTIINMENYVYTEGIFFTNPSNMLGENGWIKVYDDDTNELLHEFTNTDWNTYNSISPYQFTKEISHLRVETSSAEPQSILMIYKVNQFKKNNIVTNFTESDINNFKQIKSYLYATMRIDGIEEVSDLNNTAELEREISIANIKASPTKLSTQGTVENLNIEIETIAIQYNSKKWKNGEFILKLPTDTVDFVVNNISISENDNNKIVDYYVYEENNELYLKVKIENQISTQYKILINANIVLDSRAEEKEEELQLYAYNPRGKNHYSENMVADIYDVNKNNDREELVGLYTSKVDIEQSKDLLVTQTAYNFNQSGKTIVAPQTAIIENANRTINVDVNIKNNSSENINNIKILGKLPYENNEDLSGNSLNSEINAQLTGAIQIPTELQNIAKIYYSDQENPTKDISLVENNWKENITDYSKIKNFLITLDGYELIPNNEHDFSYEMKLPIETTYNLTGYATSVVYYETVENEEIIEKEQESHKLGVSSAKQFNMELTKYKIGTTETVEGVTFSITDVETGNITLHTTNLDGKILISNLYLEKEYELREVGAQDEYVLESREIKFKLHDTNGNMSIEILNGEFRETPTIDNETFTVYANLENEVKYDLDLNFKDQVTGLGIENAEISIQGKDADDTYMTDSSGNITIENLCPEVTYTIEEKENKGYYIYDSSKIEFKLSRVDGKLQLIVNNGEIESSNVTEDTGNIKANLDFNITKEKIPSYALKLKLYEQGKDIIVLEGAKYKITGPGKEKGEIYTTNKNGELVINDLYQYIDGKYITGEYTLREIEPPLGYALSANVVKFRVVSDKDGNLSGEVISGELREGPIIENNILEIKLNNNLLFNITKIDGESLELLPNARFTIKELVIEGETEVEKETTDEFGNILGTLEYINGSWQRVFTTNSEGIIEESIKNGIYKIEEIQAPEGYVLPENEEDRIQYIGIGQKRGAEISAEFLAPLYTEETNAESISSQYKVAGREDGITVYYYKNAISLINEKNEIVWNNRTEQIMDIIADDSKIITLTDSSIVEYDYNGNILNTYSLISGMNSIAQTSDGGYVIVGDYSGTLTVSDSKTASGTSISISSTKNGTSAWASYTQDIYILKLNSNYQVESLSGIGGTGADYSSNIIVNDDGTYIIGGFVGSTSIAGSMTNSGSAISGTFTNSIIKINQSNNKVLWMKKH